MPSRQKSVPPPGERLKTVKKKKKKKKASRVIFTTSRANTEDQGIDAAIANGNGVRPAHSLAPAHGQRQLMMTHNAWSSTQRYARSYEPGGTHGDKTRQSRPA